LAYCPVQARRTRGRRVCIQAGCAGRWSASGCPPPVVCAGSAR